MKAIIKIAIRNLRENKTKTLIIGIIIALGITFLITGNSLLETSSSGIKRSFINNFTGNIILREKTEGIVTLMGASIQQTIEGGIPSISDYTKVIEYIESLPEIENVTAQITGRTAINFEGKTDIPVTLFGIEPWSYSEMFNNNMTIISGSALVAGGVEAVLLSEFIINKINEENSIDIKVNDLIIITSFSPFGLKIRELEVKGIFRFDNSNELLNSIGFIDAESLRGLLGMNLTVSKDINLEDYETAYINFDLSDENIDSLFSGDIISESSGIVYNDISLNTEVPDTNAANQAEAEQDETFISSIKKGSWHFILIKLKNEETFGFVINKINSFIDENNLSLLTDDWLGGAGAIGRFAFVIQYFFNIIIIIISVVAVIIIMNTLVISIIERINEIGTMRAMGAGKGFIMKLIIVENLIISVIFGVLGILTGCLIILMLNLTGIAAPNIFFEILFGGKILYPQISLNIITQAMGIILGISILSSIYPVIIALRIEPVKAMSDY